MSMVYCGEMGRSPAHLVTDWVRALAPPAFVHDSDRRIIYTRSGREAILLAARAWELGSGDHVLVPSYNCGSEISPLIASGAHVTMYRVDARARVDVADLLRRIGPRTKAVLFTHYFGRRGDIAPVARVCRERDIRLLEDCALSLFSDGAGECGDAAIFSLRKSLPVGDGGVLSLRDKDARLPQMPEAAPLISTGRGAASVMKKWFETTTGLHRAASTAPQHDAAAPHVQGAAKPDMPRSYYCDGNAPVRAASRFARGALAAMNSGEVRDRRRQNYAILRDRLGGVSGVDLLWGEDDLPAGMCPLGLPIIVAERRRWHDALNAAGVVVSCWWEGYHRGLDWDEFPEAQMLKDRLILLPVHQGLAPDQLAYIATIVRGLAAHDASSARRI
jgi:perosamine synthetase